MQGNEMFTFELFGMNMLELTMYIGVALAIMLIITVVVKRR